MRCAFSHGEAVGGCDLLASLGIVDSTLRLSQLSTAQPLLHAALPPPAGSLALFRSRTDGALLSLVADHVVRGRVIFPGAGHLELARAEISRLRV